MPNKHSITTQHNTTQNNRIQHNNYQPYLPMKLSVLIALSVVCLGAQQYDVAESKQYSLHAFLAGCSQPQLQSWTCGDCQQIPNFTNVKYFYSTKTKSAAYAGYNTAHNHIIVSFRYTDNLMNWFYDFKDDQIEYQRCTHCLIHEGFYQIYRSLAVDVELKVRHLLASHPTAKIVMTGHSLGGALAMICALQMEPILPVNADIVVHSFGGPRVGNQYLARYAQSKIKTIYRVVHYRDVVPHTPSQHSGYTHAAFQVFWDFQMKNYQICDATGEDQSCSNKYNPGYDPLDHAYYFENFFLVKC